MKFECVIPNPHYCVVEILRDGRAGRLW
jgi:hypothetical protein